MLSKTHGLNRVFNQNIQLSFSLIINEAWKSKRAVPHKWISEKAMKCVARWKKKSYTEAGVHRHTSTMAQELLFQKSSLMTVAVHFIALV